MGTVGLSLRFACFAWLALARRAQDRWIASAGAPNATGKESSRDVNRTDDLRQCPALEPSSPAALSGEKDVSRSHVPSLRLPADWLPWFAFPKQAPPPVKRQLSLSSGTFKSKTARWGVGSENKEG